MEINSSSGSNNKIIMIIISVIVLIVVGVVIFQKSEAPEDVTNVPTTKTTDMKKTDTASTSCFNPAASPTYPTGSGTQLCPGGSIAYGGSGRDGADGSGGSNGSNGSSGSNGRDGTNGSNGSNGSKGADGANGATGPQGPAGPAGPAGPQGPAGQDGTDGGDTDDGGGYYGAYAENTTPKTTTGHSPQYLDAEIYTDVSAELTLAVDYATVVLTTGGSGIGNFLDGITGGTVYGDHVWTVKCNNSAGYTLALKEMTGRAAGTTGALTHTTDGANFEFLPMTGAGTPQATFPTPAAGGTAFGYSITAHTSTLAGGWTTGYWNAVIGSNVGLLDKSSASAQAGDTMSLRWQARFTTGGGQYLKNGTYKEFVTLTAATN